jgi:hypothetical protein
LLPVKENAMAKVQGVKEKIHFPLYDAFFVPGPPATPAVKFQNAMTDPRVIRFFVDVQNKTKLETNLQSAGQLPSLNSFEARALRVVVSNQRFRTPDTTPVTKEDIQSNINESEILADLIYNSVTSLIVGEKVMIEAPTWWFPSGAGVSPGFPTVSNHGQPDPTATFSFAEPCFIEPQQNFRVEMLFPRDVPSAVDPTTHNIVLPIRLAEAEGPLRIWVALDGYLTRDVQ